MAVAAAVALASALTATAAVGVPAARVPAQASAPGAFTAGATQITAQTARLNGQVNPRGVPTTYHFEYGTTVQYTANTPTTAIGARRASVHVDAVIGGLAPGTRYHFRVVAESSAGVTRGADRVLTTRRAPEALTLRAAPNPVVFGTPVTLTGTLTAGAPAGRIIQLRQNPFPFGAEPRFPIVGSPAGTDAAGNFSFTLPAIAARSRFQVTVRGIPALVSPTVQVDVLALVGLRVTRTTVRRGRRVRFSGTLRPAESNRPLAIQRRRRGVWVTVTGTVTRPHQPGVAVYGKTLRIRRAGLYRVFVGAGSGATLPNVSRTVRLRITG